MHTRNYARLISLVEGEGGNGGGTGGSGGSGGSGSAGGQGGDSGGSGGQGDGGTGNGATGGRGGAGGGSGSASGGSQTGHDKGSTSGNTGTGSTGKRKLEELSHDELVAVARELRGEAAENRTKRNAAEQQMTALQRKVAEAFGIDVDGNGAPDPDKLAADLAAAQDTARVRAVELAVYRSASERGADPAALLDSRSFLDSVADLDPSAQDFSTRLGDKITTATQNNPRLVAGGTQQAGGAGRGIGQGGRGQQSGPVGVAAGRAMHQERRGTPQNANSTT